MRLEHELRRRPHGVNVPDDERVLSTLFGTAAALLGKRRGGLLGLLLGAGGVALAARGVTGHCAVTRQLALGEGVMVDRAITILAPRAEIFRLWRNLENLPRFLEHVTVVKVLDERRSRWVIKEGPLHLEWEATIVDHVPDRRLAWQSVPGSAVEHAGYVELRDAPGGRGTEVFVAIKYRPPGGFLVEAPLRGLLRRFTRFQLDVELRRLRQLVETGEVAIGARNHETLVPHDARFATAAAAGAVPPPGVEPPAPITLEPARDEGGV
jgi:uncharacterized membrane protein